MAGPSFNLTFGGSVLYPAQSTYNTFILTQNLTLLWPTETAIAGTPVVANIMDVAPSAPGLSISFTDATQASTGYTALFNNTGANTFTVLDSTGATLMTVASGQAWLIYLADNSTAAGTWRIFQMGAGVSTANAAALAGAGLKAITTTLNAFITVKPLNTNYVSAINDRAQCLEWTGGVGSITLPDATVVLMGWFCYIKNAGSGTLTVAPPAGTIDTQASLAFPPGNSAIVVCDGTNYFTIGFGASSGAASFNFISVNLTGLVSPVTLSAAQQNKVAYEFIGALTANMVIVVPSTVQQYWINNQTTGAFTLTIQSATPGTTYVLAQGTAQILYCDGTNMVLAVSSSAVTFPITVAQGGTNATTAAGARTNLGAAAATETVSAGAGLTGGGNLGSPITLSLNWLGANVSNSVAQAAATTGTVMAWNSETLDTGAWHDTVTNNSRLTVPSGVTVAEFVATIVWEPGTAATDVYIVTITIRKNAGGGVMTVQDTVVDDSTSVVNALRTTVVTSGPVSVTAGDFFEVVVTGSNKAGSLGVTVTGLSRFTSKSLT